MEQPQVQKLKLQLRVRHKNGRQRWYLAIGNGLAVFGATFEKKCQEGVKQLKKLPNPFMEAELITYGSFGRSGTVAFYDFETDSFIKGKSKTVYEKPVNAIPDVSCRASINGKFRTLWVNSFGTTLDDKINKSMERLKKELSDYPDILLDNCFIYWQGMGGHQEKLVATYDKKSDSFIVEPKYRCLIQNP